MTFKTHPKVYRFKKITDWLSRGTYSKNLAKELEEDFKIRETILSFFGKKAMIEKIEIERVGDKINILIHTAKPGLVIGQKGELVEKLKQKIKKEILKEEKELRVEIRDVPFPWASAEIVAQWVALQLEKRLPYRKVLKQALAKASSTKGVKGVKIQVSGRLDGVEIARSEWVKKGALPRTTIRSDIDFAVKEAKTKVGIVGVKVWIYKGERED